MNWMLTAAADSIRAMLIRVAEAIPRVGVALVIFVVGWLLARAAKWAVMKVLKAVPFDQLAEKLGITHFLQRGEVPAQVSELLGISAYWVILLAFLLAALDVLGMSIAAELLQRVLSYVPQVIAGILVLFLGFFFATVVSGVVQTAAANVGMAQAKALGQIARVVVIAFSVAVALEKFLSSAIIQSTFSTVVMAFSFGAALAFGLGCKDIAGRAVQDFLNKLNGGR